MRKLGLLLLISAAAVAQKRPITHEDIWLMKRSGEPIVSPDGRSIVFALTEPDYDPAKQSVDLWIVPADGSAQPRRLTFTKAPETGTVWSPDGTRLAFVTRREGDEAAQVYVMPMAGGEAQRVSNVSGGAANPKWRPDGKAILFESDYDPMAAERKQRKSAVRIYDSMPVRYWNTWLDEKKLHIFTQELQEGAQPVDLLKGSKLAESPGFGAVYSPTGEQTLQPTWALDGKSIVFAAYANRDEMMSMELYSALYTVSASGGEPRQLTVKGKKFTKPRFSPLGDTLFALEERSAVPGGRLYSLKRLARFPWPVEGKPNIATEGWDRSVSDFSFAADGQTVYIDAEDDGADQIFHISVKGGTVQRLIKVTRGGYTAVHPIAGGFAALFQTSLQPPAIVRLNIASGTHFMLTNFNAEEMAQIDVLPPIQFWFTAKNGRRIHNIMFLPPKFDQNNQYPLVIYEHGGPNEMSKDAFSTRWNNYLLTSPGYVVLETNFAGSTGFGESFADDVEKDVLRGPRS